MPHCPCYKSKIHFFLLQEKLKEKGLPCFVEKAKKSGKQKRLQKDPNYTYFDCYSVLSYAGKIYFMFYEGPILFFRFFYLSSLKMTSHRLTQCEDNGHKGGGGFNATIS